MSIINTLNPGGRVQRRRERGETVVTPNVLWQELYQKLTDYDIRYYMYELLKVKRLQAQVSVNVEGQRGCVWC